MKYDFTSREIFLIIVLITGKIERGGNVDTIKEHIELLDKIKEINSQQITINE